jgi:exonuclease SbcD
MKKIVDNIRKSIKEDERNILVAHGYVSFMRNDEVAAEQNDEYTRAGLQTCESERPLSIGGTDLISSEHFSCFNYTALGHLHGPQRVGSDNIRYSGSLLKYSFSEKDHKKGVTIVELDEKGNAFVRHRELSPKREMRVIKGSLNHLISPEVYLTENVEDYIYAILTDDEELIDPISKLRAVYPNIMGLQREDRNEKEESRTSASSGYKSKSKLQLFQEFYKSILGKELINEKLDLVKGIIESVERGEVS